MRPVILICLQNAYGKGRLAAGWHPTYWWQEFLTSRSGKRLQLILPDNAKVHYCNVAPGLGSGAKSVLQPSHSHLRRALKRVKPDYVVACGKLAEEALIQVWDGNLVCIPHPASRVLTNLLLLQTKELLNCLIDYDFNDLLEPKCSQYQDYLPYIVRLALRQRRGFVEVEELRVEPRTLRRRNPFPLCSCGTPFGWEETGKSSLGEHEIQVWNYTPCPNCGRKPLRMFPPPHRLEKDVPWEELPSIAISIGPPPTGHTFAKMLGALEIQYPGGGTEKPYCIICDKFVEEAKECPKHPGPENIEYRPYSFRRNPRAQNVELRTLRRWNPMNLRRWNPRQYYRPGFYYRIGKRGYQMLASSLEDARLKAVELSHRLFKVIFILYSEDGSSITTLERWRRGRRYEDNIPIEWRPQETYYYRVGKSGELMKVSSLEEANAAALRQSLVTNKICYAVKLDILGYSELLRYLLGVPFLGLRSQVEGWAYKIGKRGNRIVTDTYEEASSIAKQRSLEVHYIVYVYDGKQIIEHWRNGNLLTHKDPGASALWAYRIGRSGSIMRTDTEKMATIIAEARSRNTNKKCYVLQNIEGVWKAIRSYVRGKIRNPHLRKSNPQRNPAKKLNSNVGVYIFGKQEGRIVILFDITKLRSEETIQESLLGYIYFGHEEDHLCPGKKYVAQKAVAQHGWGPVTFEIAMQVTTSDGMEGLVPDRRQITKDGLEIWRRFYLRDDIAKVPLKEGAFWGEEFLDQVYSLKTEMSFHSAKQRANKVLKRIFPYPGEAETHLWEAAESWFSSEFQGGQYRPSSRRRNLFAQNVAEEL